MSIYLSVVLNHTLLKFEVKHQQTVKEKVPRKNLIYFLFHHISNQLFRE